MTVSLKLYALFLKQQTLFWPTGNGASNAVDNTMAWIDCWRTTEHMTHKTGMARGINQFGYLTIAHHTTLRYGLYNTVDSITKNR